MAGGAGVDETIAMQATFRRAFDVCVRKTRRNIADLADEPKTWSWAEDGDYSKFNEGFFEIGNWTSSFFSGMALLAWQQTEDEYFLQQTLRLSLPYLEKAAVRHLDMHHDAGFLYTLYSVPLHKLTGDKEHRDVGLAAAEALYQRFNHQGGFIRAWGRLDEPAGQLLDGRTTDNMAIIDCLMNLPLLYWAGNETGDPKFRDIALRHADMCLKCFVRPDFSTNSVYRFNPQTWQPLGAPNNSYWARGATWAIYGFALSYGYTRQEKYLTAAVRLAHKFISHLDAEVVPRNDFHEAPHEGRVRDASAGAIAVCGFQELAKHGAADAEILQAKAALLGRLCSDEYLDFNDACHGVQKRGQGGQNGYTSWGDYYLMEALSRELEQGETFW
jgi:unsaturated chondroitin disaccharide hydrolase